MGADRGSTGTGPKLIAAPRMPSATLTLACASIDFLPRPDDSDKADEATDAIAKGKVFVNDRRDRPLRDAAARVAAGDSSGCGWIARAARDAGRRLAWPRRRRGLRGRSDHRAEQAGGLLAVPLPLQRRHDAPIGVRGSQDLSRTRGPPPAVRRPSHRPRHARAGALREERSRAARLERAVQAASTRARLLAIVYGVPSPPSGTWQDHLVWDTKALIQKETSPRDPLGKEAICHIPRSKRCRVRR